MKALVLFTVLAIATGPIFGVEMVLTDEEQVKCADEGGCGMVSLAWIKSKLAQEFERGRKACNSST
jgi:hypothetical protein